MRHASGHNYRNSSFIVDVAMGQIPRSTESISSFCVILSACCLQTLSDYRYASEQTKWVSLSVCKHDRGLPTLLYTPVKLPCPDVQLFILSLNSSVL